MTFFVQYNLTVDHLKAQHKVLAKQLHPDLGGSTEIFQAMQQEYDALLLQLQNGPNKPVQKNTRPPPDPYKSYPRQSRRVDFGCDVVEILVHQQLFGRGVKLTLIDTKSGDYFRVLMDEYVRPNDETKIGETTIRYVAASKEITDNTPPDNLVRYPD